MAETEKKSPEKILEIEIIDKRFMISHLDLSGRNLESLPECFGKLSGLRSLNLSRNKFHEVPSVLTTSVISLNSLDISHNKISEFEYPPWFMYHLVSLNISHNLFNALPLWVNTPSNVLKEIIADYNDFCYGIGITAYSQSLKNNLEYISLRNCSIRESDLLYFYGFRALKHLDISNEFKYNNLYENVVFDFNIIYFKRANLEVLNFSNLQIHLPPELEELEKLKKLYLTNNDYMYWLPKFITKVTSLEFINATSCNLMHLPPDIEKLSNLKELILSHNKLTSLPESIIELKHLEYIDLYDNEIDKLSLNMFYDIKGIDCELNFITIEDHRYEELKKNLREYYEQGDRLNGINELESEDNKQGENDKLCEDDDVQKCEVIYFQGSENEECWDSDTPENDDIDNNWDPTHFTYGQPKPAKLPFHLRPEFLGNYFPSADHVQNLFYPIKEYTVVEGQFDDAEF